MRSERAANDPVEFYRHGIGDAELASLERTLKSLFLTLGPRVREFEGAFAEYLGVEHVVGVSSCTTGLMLTLRALGVGSGHEVVTSPMTFVATSNAVLHTGARPVFADVNPRTGLVEPAAVAAAITPRTRAIIAVHLYGQLCDMPALRRIADERGLFLIEDAAHAVEARRDGFRTAELGDATTFSFYATKNLTSGDGGAIAVHDARLAEQLRCLRNHGISADAATRHGERYRHWDMLELGYKASLTDIQAALLLPQLERLAERQSLREELVARYERALSTVEGIELVERHGRSAHHLFAVLLPKGTRDVVLEGLGERRIGCAINYRSVHTLSYYRKLLGLPREALPNAAGFGERTLSLPLWPELPETAVDRVADALAAALEATTDRESPREQEGARA